MSVPDHLGDYQIVEEIGRGGFGVVYRARQVSLDRPVALKVLYEHKVHTADELARFEREARAAARLDHPSVVSVHAWGEDAGSFYIAQKLVGNGRTLADDLAQLKEEGEHPKGYFRKIADTLAAVADALQHAADHGVVHRDVKPSNVLLDDKGKPFLGDFGLAKVEDGLELSRTGDFAGSPYYMSPEQADAKRGEVDHRADIYSLGVTLYELLTLQPPFVGRTSHEIIRKILSEEPKRPSRINDRVPVDLETICLKAMEKARSRRYQTAAEMGEDLRAFLEGEPISAAPIGTVSRIWRKARRNRAGVGVVVLVAALLGMAAVAQNLFNDREDVEQQAQTASESVAATSEARQEGAGIIRDAMQTAIQDDDTMRVGQIAEFKDLLDTWLDDGQSLLLDVVPDISDNETLSNIGMSLQDQFLYESVKQASDYLSSQAEGDELDPRVAAIKNWLLDSALVRQTATQLGLDVEAVIGTAPLDVEALTAIDSQADEDIIAGPPSGPGGALSGPATTVPAPSGTETPDPTPATSESSEPVTDEDESEDVSSSSSAAASPRAP
jgi:hypothetical protein